MSSIARLCSLLLSTFLAQPKPQLSLSAASCAWAATANCPRASEACLKTRPHCPARPTPIWPRHQFAIGGKFARPPACLPDACWLLISAAKSLQPSTFQLFCPKCHSAGAHRSQLFYFIYRCLLPFWRAPARPLNEGNNHSAARQPAPTNQLGPSLARVGRRRPKSARRPGLFPAFLRPNSLPSSDHKVEPRAPPPRSLVRPFVRSLARSAGRVRAAHFMMLGTRCQSVSKFQLINDLPIVSVPAEVWPLGRVAARNSSEKAIEREEQERDCFWLKLGAIE